MMPRNAPPRGTLPRRALPILLAPLLARAEGMPRTIVAGGGLTEIVYALGAERALVGVDATSQFPSAARRLPQVGYLRALGAEGLLSLRPELIVLGHDAGPPSVVAQLRAVGRRVELMPPVHGPDAVREAVLTLGRLLHRPQAAGVAQAITEDFARLRQIIAPLPPARCLFLLSAGGGAPMASGTGTAADAMLRLAGAANAITDYTGYKPVAPEAAVAARPDAIVTTSHTLTAIGGVEALAALPQLALVPAVRARRIVSLDSLFLLGFGPRSAHAARDLAAALHPSLTVPHLPDRAWLHDRAG